MDRISCYYYLAGEGKSPVREFIDSLDFKTRRKFFFVKELLEEFGHRLPYPHARYIRNSIFELRFKGHEGSMRILYFFFLQDKVIFTNGFIKKTAKTPQSEIDAAIHRRNEFLERHTGDHKDESRKG